MKNLKLYLIALLAVTASFAQQNTLSTTTLSAAITATQTSFVVGSTTGMVAPSVAAGASVLYILDPGQAFGELVTLTAVNTTTGLVTVSRGGPGGAKAHISGALVLYGTDASWFGSYDPTGSCVTANVYVSPWVNIANGNQWLCSTLTLSWVPGFNNYAASPAVTAAVASAAGKITPSGPLFHITGSLAITGFNLPVGFNGGGFCVIPDAAFTTTATNNIALASTGVIKKTLCWTYDSNAALFYPSY